MRTKQVKKTITRVLMLIIFAFIGMTSFAQLEVTIGDGTYSSSSYPISGFYDYSLGQQLYFSNEIGLSGKITDISFYVANSPSNYTMLRQRIFMKLSQLTEFSSTSYKDSSDFTEVFSGNLTYNGGGWYKIHLTKPFYYNSDSNLHIRWHSWDGDYVSGYPSFRYTSTSTYRTLYDNKDNSFPVSPASRTKNSPNIKITFAPKAVDAGLTAIDSPQLAIPAGSNGVYVSLKNYGSNTLTSVSIDWKINNGTTNTYSWSGSLASGNSTSVKLGTYAFTNGTKYDVIAWTKNPNSSTDSVAINDTAKTSLTYYTALSGDYTVGGTGADYSSIQAAADDLALRGVLGPVTMKIASGTYTEQVTVKEVSGASASNPVKFTSATGDSTDVILQYAPSSSTSNYVLKLDGADYITFKKMTIHNTSTGSYSRVIDFSNGATNNTFRNNIIKGREYRSSSNYYALIYSSSSSPDIFNTFKYNVLKYGSYAFYLYGSSTGLEKGNVIAHNIIDSFAYYGIYSYYQDSVIINKNKISSHTGSSGVYSTVYGIRLYYTDGGSQVTGNKLNLKGTSTNYGIYAYYCDATASAPIMIVNNFISQSEGTGTTYGIYPYNCNYVNIYYNSLNITAGSSTAGRAIFINSSSSGSYGNINIKNNSFVNVGGGYAIEISSNANTLGYVTACDYNNYYASGTATYKYGTTNYTSLSAWQTGSGFDANGVESNPNYKSVANLHTSSSSLDKAATPISGILYDIDGDSRNSSTPDIGADEFTPPSVDAGISSFETANSCANTSFDVKVALRNYASDTLKSVEIHWTVNDTVKTTYNFSGDILSGKDSVITLGTYKLNKGVSYNFVFWTEKPNNISPDGNAKNDTLKITGYKASMSGTFVIGSSSGADYSSLSSAFTDLQNNGVCGPVVLNMETGSYTGGIEIKEISGASKTNNIIIKSVSGNASDVVLANAPTSSSANYTVYLNGADYITLRNITIKTTSTGSYSRVVDLSNGASNNTIENCILIGQNYGSSSYNYAVIYSNYSAADEYNTIQNNLIKYGSYGIYFDGTSSVTDHDNVIKNNKVDSFAYAGIRMENQEDVKINNNTVSSNTNYTTTYGIYMYYCDSASEALSNKVYLQSSSSNYCFYIYHCNGSSTSPVTVANNFLSQENGSSAYGTYLYYSNYVNYYYNTVNVTSGGTSGRALYEYRTTSTSTPYGNNVVKNNNLINTGGGYAIYVSSGAAQNNYVTSSDYNNLYSSGTNIGYWNNSAVTTFAAWKTASGQETHSVSTNAQFISNTDLHTKSAGINGKATPISGFTSDIDGDIRNTTTPDIGADEFDPAANDVAPIEWVSPASGCGLGIDSVKIKISNFATKAQSNFQVGYSVDGGTTVVIDTFTGTIQPGDTILFTFTVPANLKTSGTYYGGAATFLANDETPSNDTLYVDFTRIGNIDKFPYLEDFESGNTTFLLSANSQANVDIDSRAKYQGNAGLHFQGNTSTGWTGSSSSATSTNAWSDNTDHHALAATCWVDATGSKDLKLIMNHRQTYSFGTKYSWFRVLVDGSAIKDANGNSEYNPSTNTDPFDTLVFDLGSYAGKQFKITLQSSMKYNDYYYKEGDNAFVDNILLVEPPAPDLGADRQLCQGSKDTLTVSYDYNDYDIKWKKVGSSSTLSITSELVVNSSGYYFAEVTDSFGFVGYDTVKVTVVNQASLNAGSNMSICSNDSASLNATASNYASFTWSTTGDGTFSNSSTTSGWYYPGSNDLTSGSVDVIATVTSNSPCMDVLVDTITITINTLATVDAGLKDTICENSSASLKGLVSNASMYYWTTKGDGSFNDSSLVNASYTPGSSDISSKTTTLSLLAKGTGACPDVSDDVEINIQPVVQVDAGAHATICENGTAALDGTVADYQSLVWSTSGDGSFNDASIEDPVYTPGTSDLSNGMFTLYLTASSVSPCFNILSDSTVIDITKNATVAAGNDDTICETATASLAATATDYSAVNWISAGDGSFDDSTSLTPVYTPGLNDIANGNVELVISATSTNPCSITAYDTLMIYIETIPVISAGVDDTICETNDAKLMASFMNANTYNWTSLGDGTFADATLLQTTYTAGAGDVSMGYADLVIEATGSKFCSAVFDTVRIYVDEMAVITGDSTGSICEYESFNTNLSISKAQKIIWSGKGDGTFDDNTIEKPVYTPGSSDISNKAVNLMVEALSEGICPVATAGIMLTINPQPAVDLGKDTIVDAEFSITLDAGAGMDSYKWSTSEQTQTIDVDSSGVGEGTKTIWVEVSKNGCVNSDTIEVSFKINGIYDELGSVDISIYPNPARTYLNVKVEGLKDGMNLQLINAQGQLVRNLNLGNFNNGKTQQIDVSDLAKGIYFIKLGTGNNQLVEKIVIE